MSISSCTTGQDFSIVARHTLKPPSPAAFLCPTRTEDDPVAQAIHGLLDHAVETDRRIECMLKTMAAAGVKLPSDVENCDKFDAGYLSKIVD